MNYGIVDIKTKRQFPDAEQLEEDNALLTLKEYEDIARKVIIARAEQTKKSYLMKLLDNDDAICNIVNLIAWADCDYDNSKGLTRYEYRRQRAYQAVTHFTRIGHLKREMKLGRLPENTLLPEHAATGYSVDNHNLLNDLVDFTELTERERTAIDMKRKGYSYKDIIANIGANHTQEAQQALNSARIKMTKTSEDF